MRFPGKPVGTPSWWTRTHPLWLLYACTTLVVMVLTLTDLAVVLNLRKTVLANTETELAKTSLILAKEADRSLKAIDLVLDNVAAYITAEGVTSSANFQDKMATLQVHDLLREKLSGLPYVNTISMVNVQGRLINFSRAWPVPFIDLSDRDYFRALRDDQRLSSYLSAPVRNRDDGRWTIYLARRVNAPDGTLVGMLLGGVLLQYYEDFYRSVALGADSSVSLLRQDGVLLVRDPPIDAIGQRLTRGGQLALRDGRPGVIRDVSPFDGTSRIKAAHALADYPLAIVTTRSVAAALRGWSKIAWQLSLVTAGCVLAIIIAALAIGHWWQQQQTLGQERADRAEAEKASVSAQAELLRERERHAKDASRAKSDFLAMMSHEIRTPMSAVLGLTGTLLEEHLTQPQRKIAVAIRDSGDDLVRILNDILDFSRLEAGRLELEPRPFSPAVLTQNVVSILGPRAIKQALVLEACTDPTLPAALLGDAGRIRQVLLNLVSNAIKFTPRGSVTINVRCLSQAAGTATLEWTVSDTGIGIAPERLGSLFQDFVQADSSIARRFGGSGLGLAISKRIVDQMGGNIAANSTLGQGTSFRVELTLPRTATIAADPHEMSDVGADLAARLRGLDHKLRVLLAEDNPTNQFVARQLLKGFDVQIDVADNGLEAVEAATSFAYDLICMDMRMPELDGLQATQAIRRKGGRLANIPIVALTASAFPEDVRACLDAGMDDFVAKPVHKDMLAAAILRAIDKDGLCYRYPAVAHGTASCVDTPTFDHDALDALAHDLGDDAVHEMAGVFLEETTRRLLRMSQSPLSAEDLIRETHTLKGAAATACAPRLAECAAALETKLVAGGKAEPAELRQLEQAFQDYERQYQTYAGNSTPVSA